MLSTGVLQASVGSAELTCVGCYIILVNDVCAQLDSISTLPDGKCLVKMMHQTLLMMHWKFSKVLELGCTLDIYPVRY